MRKTYTVYGLLEDTDTHLQKLIQMEREETPSTIGDIIAESKGMFPACKDFKVIESTAEKSEIKEKFKSGKIDSIENDPESSKKKEVNVSDWIGEINSKFGLGIKLRD